MPLIPISVYKSSVNGGSATEVALLSVTTAPSGSFAVGSKYYNSSTKKIVTAVTADTWTGATSADPVFNTIYTFNSLYYIWDGNSLEQTDLNLYATKVELATGLAGKIDKYSILPTATIDYVGIIAQYVGTTGDGGTNGYFYKGTSTPIDSSITAGIGTSTGITEASVVKATFEGLITATGTYNFIFNGTDWTYDGDVVTLSTYGISVTGTPNEFDVVVIEYTATTYAYSWERVDVQPANTDTIMKATNNGLTIVGDIATGSENHYLEIDGDVDLGNAMNWEFTTKFTYKTGGTEFQPILDVLNNTNAYIAILQINNADLNVRELQVLLSANNGSSFDIINTAGTSIKQLTADTPLWIKFGFTGGFFYVKTSDDGINYLQNWALSLANKQISNTKTVKLLSRTSDYTISEMDLSQTSIKADGQIVWDGEVN